MEDYSQSIEVDKDCYKNYERRAELYMKNEDYQLAIDDYTKSLEIVNLPEDLIKIGDGAFRDCVSLERINVYDECDYIADNAFEGCDKLTIYGIKGSYAEQYANEHNIPFEELDTTYEPTN